jgi:hypothetical protein
MASVAELKKSFFAGIDRVENREDLEKLRVGYLGRGQGILTTTGLMKLEMRMSKFGTQG